MAFKLDMTKFGNGKAKETVHKTEEVAVKEEKFVMGAEPVETKTEVKQKESPVTAALSESGPLSELPDISFMISEEKVDEDKVAAEILHKEGENASAILESELETELNAIDEGKPKIRVAVIGGNEQYYKTVLSQLGANYPDISFIKFINTGGKNAFYTIDALNPDILFVYHQTPVQSAIQFYEAIQTETDASGIPYREKYADKRVIVLAPDDYEYAAELRAHGIQYIVMENNPKIHSVDIEQLVGNIRAAYQEIGITKNLREKRREEAPVAPVEQSIPSYTQDMQKDEPKPHKIIGVYSASGGSGKTLFATNLAGILSKYTMGDSQDYRVCLVEYNLSCKNVDLFFNIKTSKSLAKLAQEVALTFKDPSGQIDVEPRQMIPLISRYIERIPEIGLDILPGISVPLEIDRINKNFTNCLFPALREMYDVVIVDMSADIAKTPMLEALNNTDEFYVIMPMDVPSIRNARVIIKFLTGMFKKSSNEIKVILNKVNVDNEEFGVDQVYSALASDNCVPEGTIPDMPKDALSSINTGNPLALTTPEHPIAQAIYSIAVGINPMLNTGLLEQEQNEKKKSGLLGKIFGKKDKEKVPEKPKLGHSKRHSDDDENEEDDTSRKHRPSKQSSRRRKEDNEEDYEEETPKKKGGFLSRLFGSKKKKKDDDDDYEEERPKKRPTRTLKKKQEDYEEDDYEDEEEEEEVRPRRKSVFPPRRNRH